MACAADVLTLTDAGLYCPAGDLYIDPWRPVDRAIITHAHSDHARPGCAQYLCAAPGAPVLRCRLGDAISVQTLDYGAPIQIGEARVSLHPAGHVLGSAQVRVETHGGVWVVSGDYKLDTDEVCTPFEPVRCDVFITECTFGLPIFRWPPQAAVIAEINQWWRTNSENDRTSVLYAYALGKAQRVLAGIDTGIGPVLAHGAIMRMNQAYGAAGVELPAIIHATDDAAREHRGRALVLAPPSAMGSTWLRKFGEHCDGYVSGWMQIRGMRRWRSIDRGFVLSDHADWDGLQQAIRAGGAARIGLTHGYTEPMARWLNEQGLETTVYPTRFHGELEGEESADGQ